MQVGYWNESKLNIGVKASWILEWRQFGYWGSWIRSRNV